MQAASGPPQFRLAGIPVRIELAFFLIAAVMGFYSYREAKFILYWVPIVFVSILVHELGHAVAARALHDRPSIVLYAFGGLTSHSGRHTRRGHVFIILAGPLSALVLLGIPSWLLRESDWAALTRDSVDEYVIAQFLVWVNVYWSIANLVPLLPLDGGQVMAQLVGVTRARRISVVTGIGLALWLLSRDLRFAALFAGMFAVMNFAALRREGQGPPSRPAPAPTPLRRNRGASPPSLLRADATPEQTEAMAWDRIRNRDAAAARMLAEVLPTERRFHVDGAAALVAGETSSALRILEHAFVGGPPPNLVTARLVANADMATLLARRLLVRNDQPGQDGASALAESLHFAGQFPAAAHVAELLHADGRINQAHAAFSAACAWSRAGEPERALDWLGRSVDAGFNAGRLLDGEPDLAPVRSLPGWATLRARLA